MKKITEIASHVFFWVVFTLFAFMLSKIYLQADPDAAFARNIIFVVFLELVMGMLFFYISFFGIGWAKKRMRNKLILSVVLIILLLFFAYPAMQIGKWEVLSSILPHGIVIFLAFIFRRFSDSIKLEKEKQELMLQTTKSELAMLKMQMSPHFLFNTLNNIDYLVDADPLKASACIAKLGDLLRYSLYGAEAVKIPLVEEISHIEDYIELIRIRIPGDEYLSFENTSACNQLQIAPMLLIPLVENAFKHSPKGEKGNVISVFLKTTDSKFTFEATNVKKNGSKSTTTEESGIGLKSVKRRLQLLYAEKHRIIISETENRFKVTLTIELDEF